MKISPQGRFLGSFYRVGIGVVIVSALCGCNRDAADAEKFARVEIGDRREKVVATMGEPDAQTNFQLPMGAEMEVLKWQRVTGKTYTVHIILAHVVAKATVKD